MPTTTNLNRALAAACACAALWLTGCGGSSGRPTSTSRAAKSTKATTTSTSTADSAAKARKHKASIRAFMMYASCLRAHGQHVPPLNTTGQGPLIRPGGVNTETPQFNRASAACLPKAEAFYNAHAH